MKKNSVFAYKKVAAQITRLLRREVGPRILALRKKRRLRISTKKTYADIVTAGDKLSEQILRQYIENQYPSHKIYGEEISAKNPSGSKFEWFIDPIDGTIPYASGGENFGVCIGLVEGNVPRAGIIFYPAKNKMLYAIAGQGTFLDNVRIKNIKRKVELNNAVVALAAPSGPGSANYIDRYVKPVNARVRSTVFSGSYSTDALQLIEGSLDAAVLANATAYDAAATMVIAKEAGFSVGTIDGEKIDFHKSKIPVIYSATKKLQKQLIALL